MQGQKTHFRSGLLAQLVPLSLFAGLFLLQACALDAATSGRVVVRDRSATADARIDSRDRALIEEHYRNTAQSKRAPAEAKGERAPGLAKGERLPPVQGKPLPPDLETRLSPVPRPYVRLVVGGDIVLVNKETRVIADIMPAAVPQ